MKPIIKLLDLNLTQAEIEKFYSKINIGAANECWEWKEVPNTWGYGQYRIRSNPRYQIQAHRLAFFLHWKVDPEDWRVCHECDNPACCNWQHLFIGTQKINMEDKLRKNRQAQGETNGGHKLTAAQVAEIRLRFANRETTLEQLSAIFSIHEGHLDSIIKRRFWKSI